MTPLLPIVLAVLAQVPDISPPPLLDDAPPAVMTGADPAFIEAVDRKLLSFRQEGFGLRLANKEKSLVLGSLFWDSELEMMFASVPSSVVLFQEARDKTFISAVLTLGGFIGVAGSFAVLAVFLLAPAPSLALLGAALAFDAVALLLTLISIPFRMRAQAALYEAVETHNRGLLRLPFSSPPPLVGPVVLRF